MQLWNCNTFVGTFYKEFVNLYSIGDRYPSVKSMMIPLYANHNSMIKVGKILGEHIFSPFSLDEKRFLHAIPRQMIQSTIKNHPQIVFSLKKT